MSFKTLARRLLATGLAVAALFALSMMGSRTLRAQARTTLDSLQTQVNGLQSQVNSLQTQVTTLQSQLSGLQTQVGAILNGTSPVGRYAYVSSGDSQSTNSTTLVAIPGRTLNYTKQNASSNLKITYSEHI